MLATGACTEPYIPAWSGRDTFGPPMVHSSDYRNPAPYAGSRVLVVGSGNSATEVAVDLASSGKVTVEMAVRTPPSIVRRDIRGIPTQPLGIALRHAPAAVGDPLGAALRRLTIPDLSSQGLPAPRRPSPSSTGQAPSQCWTTASSRRSGTKPSGFSPASPRSTATTSSTATAHDPDRTQSSPPPATSAGLQAILGPLGILDDRGLPTIGSRGSVRTPLGGSGGVPPGIDTAQGLYTVGISIPLSGLLREIGIDVKRLVRSIGHPTD